jgi:hypothetical protein
MNPSGILEPDIVCTMKYILFLAIGAAAMGGSAHLQSHFKDKDRRRYTLVTVTPALAQDTETPDTHISCALRRTSVRPLEFLHSSCMNRGAGLRPCKPGFRPA